MVAVIRFVLLKSHTVKRADVFVICRFGHSDPMFRSPSFDPSSLVLYVFGHLPQFIVSILLSCCDFPFLSFFVSLYHFMFVFVLLFQFFPPHWPQIYSPILMSSLSFILSTFSYSPLSSFTLFHTLNIQLAVVFFSHFLSSPCLSRQHAGRSGLRSSGEARHIFQIVQVSSGAHWTSYSMCTTNYFPGGKAVAARGRPLMSV
jgi:hypothetical protein